MTKIKLSEIQKHRLNIALREASSVLNEIKQKTLTGKALDDMKILEDSIVCLGGK